MTASDDDLELYGMDDYSPAFLVALDAAEEAFPSSFCAPPPSSLPLPTQVSTASKAEDDDDDDDEFGWDAMPLTQEMHDALEQMEEAYMGRSQMSEDSETLVGEGERMRMSDVEVRSEEEESLGTRAVKTEVDSDSDVEICSPVKPRRVVLKLGAPSNPVSRKRKRASTPYPVGDSDAESDFSDDMDIYTPAERKPIIPRRIHSPISLSSSSSRSPSPPPTRAQPPAPPPTHLSEFFGSFPEFKYDPAGPSTQQYDALRDLYRARREWNPDVAKRAAAAFKTAMTMTFTDLYGAENSLENWQRLCEEVRAEPLPGTIGECQQAMRDAHVNLVDLTDKAYTGRPVVRFPSEQALASYTFATKKFFPLERARESPLLRLLLRHILSPRVEGRPLAGGPPCKRQRTM
ncbi:hypothetical protein MIND_00400900 [Mycena indigotica]|uniref:Uncharacterized protein n=1 Tax=Mycena indigotica TaxID=2126181 RepID=A0A8H6T6E2_9AGAR|nr:uncharacterized protein MIND_00400900 [Mycena indigotica]KAF7310270.1 hypothetical protein MIND_00400900 [Mycena indigotica]